MADLARYTFTAIAVCASYRKPPLQRHDKRAQWNFTTTWKFTDHVTAETHSKLTLCCFKTKRVAPSTSREPISVDPPSTAKVDPDTAKLLKAGDLNNAAIQQESPETIATCLHASCSTCDSCLSSFANCKNREEPCSNPISCFLCEVNTSSSHMSNSQLRLAKCLVSAHT